MDEFKIELPVICPYCQQVASVVFDELTAPAILYCNPTIGGCDENFGVGVERAVDVDLGTVTFSAKTTMLVDGNSRSALVGELMNCAMSAKKPLDVFVRYLGHIDTLSVSANLNAVYKDGGDHGKVLTLEIDLEKPESCERLKEAINAVRQLVLTHSATEPTDV